MDSNLAFHLDFNIPQSPDKINLKDRIVSMGSCFAQSMGEKLSGHKFDCLNNPFGMIYNPESICQLLQGDIREEDLVESQGVFFHWQAHGLVAGLDEKEVKKSILIKRDELRKRLASADWLIVTFGSAFAYRLKSSGQIVANCHKIPQKEFVKELLEIDEIYRRMSDTLKSLKDRNAKLKTILTVSPVRHFRDGLVENNRSKARLIEVVQRLSWEHDWIKYFPAYEILIDELRDYRFYAKDRVHPSEEAVDYIWQKFGETYFDEDTSAFVKEWTQIRGMMNHRPIHPQSEEHRRFLEKILERLNRLSKKVGIEEEVL